MLNTITRSQRRFTAAIISVVLLSVATASNAETAEVKIARAITAAPSDITNEATIMDVDGTVLRVDKRVGLFAGCRTHSGRSAPDVQGPRLDEMDGRRRIGICFHNQCYWCCVHDGR